MDSIRTVLTAIKDLLVWLPDPAVALIILALAAAIAFVLHKVLARLARRILAVRYPNSLAILNRLRALTRSTSHPISTRGAFASTPKTICWRASM
jgi:hypothetical protein